MTTNHNRATGWQGLDFPSYDVINSCVRCGLCLPTCPTYLLNYRETSSPRGRIQLMKAVSDGVLDVRDDGFNHQMYECLDCRACEAVCPSGVLYGRLIERARYQVEASTQRALHVRLLRWAVFGVLFADMRVFRRLSRAMWLYQRSGARAAIRRSGVLRLLGMERVEALAPELGRTHVVARGQVLPAEGERRHRVGLFTGCVMSTVFAQTHEATVRVLRRNGCEVVLPKNQGCCAALHIHGGEFERGRALMRANIEAFERCRLDYVIVNAAGCGSTLKEYSHLLEREPEWASRAREFSARVRDVSEFLGSIELDTRMAPVEATATYQEACHLVHAQRISAQPRRLLAAIPGLRLVEMDEASVCCGSAGVYNLTQPEYAGRLLDRKLDNALAVEPDVIVSSNAGCILQMQAGLRRRGVSTQVKHIVELLDEAYRGVDKRC